jgi:hypothetical protein
MVQTPMIFHIEYLLPILTFWHTISTEISKYKSEALTNNIVSFIHCVTYICHYNYEYNMEYMVHMSIGYFTYDLCKMLYYYYYYYAMKTFVKTNANANANVEFKQSSVYIIHHIVTIYLFIVFFTELSYPPVLYSVYILESSNIMLYISYYIHKEYKHRPVMIAISEGIQLVSNCYYRVFLLSDFIYEHRDYLIYKIGFIEQLTATILYTMGIVWSYLLFLKTIKNVKRLMK